MRSAILKLLLGSMSLVLVQGQVPVFTCPSAGDEPVEVPVPTLEPDQNSFRVKIPKVASKTATCILTRVVAKKPTVVDLSTFSMASDSNDFTLIPVSRSYKQKPWEQVAGPYSQTLNVKCKSNACTVKVPILPDLPDGKFFLMTFEHSISKPAQLSRFFQKSTFGTTRELMNSFTYAINKKGFSRWIKDQTNSTLNEPTLHRAYFRKNADFAVKGEDNNVFGFAPRHPCDINSRWRDYSFTGDDFAANFVVIAFGDKFLIEVDGEPRTVVDVFEDNRTPVTYSGAGTYIFCYSADERVNGKILFRKFAGQPCKELNNHKIVLPEEVFALYTSVDVRLLDLPNNFEEITAVVAPEKQGWFGGGSLRLLESNWGGANDQACNDLGADYRQLLGVRTLQDGTKQYVHYAGYGDLQENTIESPIPDGGASKLANGVRITANVSPNFMNWDSCRLGRAYINSGFNPGGGYYNTVRDNALVCGSSGEVGNNPAIESARTNIFHFFPGSSSVFYSSYPNQKGNVFVMTALESQDQLRQRVAWALAQTFVVTVNQIDAVPQSTEMFLHYHDIFVRNAFGNYGDILKEVSYSPMMAEMLSFVESRSAAYVLFNEGRESRADENYAREIMQLFTIGIYMLNEDGSIQYDADGSPVPTYDNTDIQNFARAWTGFRRQYRRGNREGYDHQLNRIDIMHLESVRRDQFPKMDLLKGFIGDTYPLCEDLPDKQFLRKGAEYRLLGSYPLPVFHSEPTRWENQNGLTRFSPSPESPLFNLLCGSDGSGNCQFTPRIKVKDNLECHGDECRLDNVRLVKIEDVFYEYIKPPCVELSFYPAEKLRKVVDRRDMALCLHKDINDGALASCCDGSNQQFANSHCDFTAERVSWETSASRCLARDSEMCDVKNIRFLDTKCNFHYTASKEYFEFVWSNASSCSIQARVGTDGVVALVHKPSLDINAAYPTDAQQYVFERVNAANRNFFKVVWKDSLFPDVGNGCGNPACAAVSDGCLCDVDVVDTVAFSSQPTLSEIKAQLKIGSPNPKSYDPTDYTLASKGGGLQVYHQNNIDGTPQLFSKNTVFGIKYRGKRIFLKNVVSTVSIGTDYSFRNPPRFMSLTSPEGRDAAYETEAVLDNYLYHPNTPPFVAKSLIQRFGISNPSPRYISQVSTAFKTGVYSKKKLPVSFGNGRYGDLEATIAAILLDREATSVALDADPSAGSLREPLIKFISVMRSLEFEANAFSQEIRMERLLEGIGQAAHFSPDVFSFFRPEYAAPGQIIEASLTSPEAQVMNAPTIVGFLNGIFSLIDLGLTRCYGGFGNKSLNNCLHYTPGKGYSKDPEVHSFGMLRYAPTFTSSEDIVDDLAILLTGGRMSATSRASLVAAYASEADQSNAAGALRLLQKLMITSPEFHSTNIFHSTDQLRPVPDAPVQSDEPYKAIVFFNLNGGMDGFNMLVPHVDCPVYTNYANARGFIALPPNELLPLATGITGQVCDKFSVHKKLTAVRDLFDRGQLSFVANMGILQQPVQKDNWRKLHSKTALFAHNIQTEETANLDIFEKFNGAGVGGRILDALAADNYKTGAISVAGSAPPIASKSTPLLVVNPKGYEKFDQVPWTSNVAAAVRQANSATTVGSSYYGDTWSNQVYQSLSENDLLFDTYNGVQLSTSFPSSRLGAQFAAVSRLIQTKDDRGKDRDIFFVEMPGFDLHADIKLPLENLFVEINGAIEAFEKEMSTKGLWEDVTVVLASEFGRTLMGNSANGSDHAWGGNYWVAGGAVAGGKILGNYPGDLSLQGPQVIDSGIVIPTTPWESVWSAVAEWFGVDSTKMDTILPNRGAFEESDLWSASDLFTSP